MELTKGQQGFLQQRAQQELVKWCDAVMKSGDTKETISLYSDDPYVRYAADRKTPWIKDKGLDRGNRTTGLHRMFFILSPGWSAATSFLKR